MGQYAREAAHTLEKEEFENKLQSHQESNCERSYLKRSLSLSSLVLIRIVSINQTTNSNTCL